MFSHSRASRIQNYFNYANSFNHGGQQCFSVFHDIFTLNSILLALYIIKYIRKALIVLLVTNVEQNVFSFIRISL